MTQDKEKHSFKYNKEDITLQGDDLVKEAFYAGYIRGARSAYENLLDAKDREIRFLKKMNTNKIEEIKYLEGVTKRLRFYLDNVEDDIDNIDIIDIADDVQQ